MKKSIFLLAAFSLFGMQQSFAQETGKQLLQTYYNIKDALVAGKPDIAAAQAKIFSVAAASLKDKRIHEPNRAALVKDAAAMAASPDLKKQREYFVALSDDMIHLAHDIKLSEEPVYEQYCPMKKASWLSPENKVRNPYFGSSMLSCGSVTGTIQ